MIELGATAKDIVTGFEGIVTGRAQYLTGCDQYVITPKVEKGSFQEGRWFDENRLAVQKAKVVTLPALESRKTGGPATGVAAPVK